MCLQSKEDWKVSLILDVCLGSYLRDVDSLLLKSEFYKFMHGFIIL